MTASGVASVVRSVFRRSAATIACKSLGSVKQEHVTLCIKYTVYSVLIHVNTSKYMLSTSTK